MPQEEGAGSMDDKAAILIVDDDASARLTLEALLFKEEYALSFAETGQEALDILDQVEPDVILLDVMMPGIDGYEVCRQLKESERWQHIPVILVTALDQDKDMVQGLNVGADDFLRKPVSGNELRARVRSMLRIKRQYDSLKAVLQTREDLAAMIVHDMRSPIMAILGYAQFLEMNIENPANLEDVEGIQREATRLSSFLNDLLTLAKMESGKLLLNRQRTDLCQLAQEVAQGQEAVARSREVEICVRRPDACVEIDIDHNLFYRVLDNLVSNAIKFSPTGGVVTVVVVEMDAEQVGLQPCLRIIDQGPGIPEPYRDRIFDKFEILALRQEGVQIGLGLAFCKAVIEAHGGCIVVNAHQPQGTVFAIQIPYPARA
jgi:signal transduction histidine kinase